MAAYKLFFKKSVHKDFDNIPKKDLKRILSRIETLSENPLLSELISPKITVPIYNRRGANPIFLVVVFRVCGQCSPRNPK